METTKGYRLLMRRVRRGVILFRILWLASIGLAGLALVTPNYRSWAIVGFSSAILFVLGMHHVRKRYILAWKVSENPQIVYWAHPTRPFEPLSNDALGECKLLTLHLRDGTQLDVDLPPKEMCNFIAWLREQNPSVRLGAYDDLKSTTKTEGA